MSNEELSAKLDALIEVMRVMADFHSLGLKIKVDGILAGHVPSGGSTTPL